MKRMQRNRKSAMARLRQIERLLGTIKDRIVKLEDTPHIPRSGSLPRGQIPTILNECDPTCPTCALERKYYRRQFGLREPQQAALIENAQSRAASESALARSRQKITRKAYLIAAETARNRDDLAYLLDVSREGLRKWEFRNRIKWTKNNGISRLS